MVYEMTQEEYADKHSLFTEDERMNYKYQEQQLLRADAQSLIGFWQDKRELFRDRVAERLLNE